MSKWLWAIVAAVAVLSVPTLAAGDDMKCPRGWEYWSHRFDGQPYARSYFVCDYTTRTCERGVNFGSIRVFEVLNEDRTTVIGHGLCQSGSCIDFDRGVVVLPNGASSPMGPADSRCAGTSSPTAPPSITYGPKE